MFVPYVAWNFPPPPQEDSRYYDSLSFGEAFELSGDDDQLACVPSRVGLPGVFRVVNRFTTEEGADRYAGFFDPDDVMRESHEMVVTMSQTEHTLARRIAQGLGALAGRRAEAAPVSMEVIVKPPYEA
jgi:hypothetical protein